MSFEEAVPLLAARVFDVYKSSEGEIEEAAQGEGSGGANVGSGYRVNDFVREAFEMQITPFMLDSFANDFAEQVRVATSHRREIDTLKIQNKNLQAKVKSLEDQMGAVQQEHVDLVKSVVMAKLAKEEMAEEVSGQTVACKPWSTRLFWRLTAVGPVQAHVRRGYAASRPERRESVVARPSFFINILDPRPPVFLASMLYKHP